MGDLDAVPGRASTCRTSPIRANGYGFPGEVVDGNDFFAVRDAAERAVSRARAGEGPTLIEAKSYRITPHSAATPNDNRPPEELELWRSRDPIVRFAETIVERQLVAAERVAEIEEEALRDVEEAIEFALGSPFPAPEAARDGRVCPERVERRRPAAMTTAVSTRELTMSEALNEALREEMRRDDGVFVIGEDIGRHGGLFKVTDGLLDRVRVGAGDRLADLRGGASRAPESAPRSSAAGRWSSSRSPTSSRSRWTRSSTTPAKWRYMSGGQVSVPFVIRGPISNGIGMAAQHSQSLESWFVHTPGLIVVMPSTPYDAKGLLKAAIREDNPVVFLEKRLLYARKGPVPESEYVVPLGVADVKRAGSDVTVVAAGATVPLALQAARQLAREGVELEVIDVRTLKPLDADDDRRVDREDRPTRRRQRGTAHGRATRPRSSRAWSRRWASTRSAPHRPASRRRTRRSRTRPRSSVTCCRQSTTSSRRSTPMTAA